MKISLSVSVDLIIFLGRESNTLLPSSSLTQTDMNLFEKLRNVIVPLEIDRQGNKSVWFSVIRGQKEYFCDF